MKIIATCSKCNKPTTVVTDGFPINSWEMCQCSAKEITLEDYLNNSGTQGFEPIYTINKARYIVRKYAD